MPLIEFTQYLRPDGEQRKTFIERPQEICDLAKAITDAGFKLESEVLTNGVVSLTIAGKTDVYMELVWEQDEKKIAQGVDALIRRFKLEEARHYDEISG